MNDKTTRKIMIACGGTGGHFYPGLTIAGAAREAGIDVAIALSGKNLEQFSEAAKNARIPVFCQTELRRPTERWKLPLLAWNILADIRKSFKLLKKEKPDAVVGMGSFASFSFCFAAAMKRIPVYLHEGNAVIGKSNCMLSRWARKIFLSFSPLNASKLKCKSCVDGFPVRKELITAAKRELQENEKERIYKIMGLDPHRKTVLIFGGSQGAVAINTTVSQSLYEFYKDAQFQIIHIVGANCDEEAIKRSYHHARIKHIILNYVQKMEHCYQIADLAICRAGASSIYELARFSVPSVLIPLPTAADDHQTANARQVEEQCGAIVIPQSMFNGESLFSVINDWLTDEEMFAEMAEKMNVTYGQGNPAAEFVESILDDLDSVQKH